MSGTQDRPLKILISAMTGIGHLNACTGIGRLLCKRGHEVYFAFYSEFRAQIEKNGMKFIALTEYEHKDFKILEKMPINPDEFKSMLERTKRLTPLEFVKDEEQKYEMNIGFQALLEASKAENYAMLNVIDAIKPDICMADYLWVMPWMVKVDVPVVPIMSVAPCELYNGPPLWSGYSVNDPPELWEEYRKAKNEFQAEFLKTSKEIFKMFGVDYVDETYAKQLGVYIYPGPLDYKELGQPKKNWVRLDSSIRTPETTEFKIPEKIASLPGKLIYVSLGTLASMVPEIMNMILEPLSKTPHRYIVSTGIGGDSVKLYDNMWGDKFVNQIALLPHIDLFITHGGSNSMIEGLAAGQPLLVIPQFGDQFNNGQRVVDLDLGSKLNLNQFTGEKLVNEIESLLIDQKVKANVLQISEELKKSDSSEEVCSLIEKLARTKSF